VGQAQIPIYKKKSLLLAKIKFEPIFFIGSLAVFIQKGLIAGWAGGIPPRTPPSARPQIRF
jgi:hypothetical protein